MTTLRPTSPLRARLLDQINKQYERQLEKGMSLADYPGETIQCRNELDRTNWLGLVRLCEKAIRDEAAFYEAMQLPQPETPGNFPIPAPGIRCTSNAFIRPTVAETIGLMDQVLTYAKDAQANWWRLKDLAKTAETWQALEVIDLEEGWP